jgi:hypothetical protein
MMMMRMLLNLLQLRDGDDEQDRGVVLSRSRENEHSVGKPAGEVVQTKMVLCERMISHSGCMAMQCWHAPRGRRVILSQAEQMN